MNRKSRKEFLKSVKVKGKVSVLIPPEVKPLCKECGKIGRNDPCPCGQTEPKAANKFTEFKEIDDTGIKYSFQHEPEFTPVKYKNCCLKSGKYEEYKRV